ncbi:hypothetical protein LCGC14_1523740 [marine sediment metagenome]|uniref:Uncharacterized protein n=1 Tax=marine sediment metagenome TaxID=412755 RepID=A0A0F9IXX6_9ZZZZ
MKFPGWLNSQSEVHVRIITTAKEYIIQGEPETEWLLNNNTYSHAALSGYRAIRIIYEIEEEFVNNLSQEIWQKWIPIILLFPFNSTENGSEEAIRKSLLRIAYPNAKENFFLALSAEIDNDNQNNSRLFIIDRIKEIYDNDLLNFLHRKALEEDLTPISKGNLFSFLLKHNFLPTIEYINELLSNRILEERDLTIQAAKAFILYSPESHWEVIWPIIQNNEEWGRETLELVAENDRFSKKFFDKCSEMQLAHLYIWLAEHYTIETDTPFTSGARFFTREDYTREWRDSILKHIESIGSFESVDAIRYISNALPEMSDYFSYVIIRANENARSHSWESPTPRELNDLFQNPTSRLIQSGEQLLDLISESLSRLEDKIQGRDQYSPAARFLWDHIGNRKFRPVVEDDFSDYVKNHLLDDIKQDIVINREVEISPLGRTDLLISALKSEAILTQNQVVSVVVEVKGKWNPELKTAMQNQLLKRYMIPRSLQNGMYLVGWFESQYWDEDDTRQNRHRTINNIEDLRNILEEKAQEISSRGFIIKSNVVNVSLNEIHESMYRRSNEND